MLLLLLLLLLLLQKGLCLFHSRHNFLLIIYSKLHTLFTSTTTKHSLFVVLFTEYYHSKNFNFLSFITSATKEQSRSVFLLTSYISIYILEFSLYILVINQTKTDISWQDLLNNTLKITEKSNNFLLTWQINNNFVGSASRRNNVKYKIFIITFISC